MADQVMKASSALGQAPAGTASGSFPTLQRACAKCSEEEEKPLQRRAASTSPVAGPAPPVVHEVLGSSGQPLDRTTRSFMESRFGADFSGVRVHADARAGRSADAVNALAYTVGSNVVFARGQYRPHESSGQRLLAHELAHVVQQGGRPGAAVRRQIAPLGFEINPCVINPFSGKEVCASDAAKLCSKMNLPGCSAVCRLVHCDKKPDETNCPDGWRSAGSRAFAGQCCRGTESARNCCPAARIGVFEGLVGRCCREGEVVVDNRCRRMDGPSQVDCLPPARLSLLGNQCCFPPQVPMGLGCGRPSIPEPPTPTPTPVISQSLEIFFRLDRPFPGESGSALKSAATPDGGASFDALVSAMIADTALFVQLVGRASPDGPADYNMTLGERRARMVAAALKSAGVSPNRIADPPVSGLEAECQVVSPGIVTCGEAGATGERDRQVLGRLFNDPSRVA
jgi:hypothetical protein